MGTRTTLRQDNQLQNSVNYVQNLGPGVALQNNAVSTEDDLNALRSQASRLLDATGGTDWYADVPTVNGKKRGLLQLNTSLNTIETKPMLQWVRNTAAITVPNGQNYIILNVSSGQAPSLPAAIVDTTLGAVVARGSTSAAAFASHDLAQATAPEALSPWNLCSVHDATNGQILEHNDLDIFGLLQVESTGTDGAAFNDTSGGNRVKISFVTINYNTMTYQAASPAAVQGRSIQFTYSKRQAFQDMPQNAYLGSVGYIDNVAAVDVTLTRAVMNQGGAGVPVTSNVLWQLASGYQFKVQNQSGTLDYFAVDANGNASYAVGSYNVNSQQVPNFTKGVSVSTAGQTVNVGVTPGQVDSAGLTLQSTGSNPLKLVSGNSLSFKDGYQPGSTYTTPQMPFASSATDWTNFANEFGSSTSLLNAIYQAAQQANHSMRNAVVTAPIIPSGTNVTGAGASPNIDTQLFDYTTVPNGTIASAVKVYYNGQLTRYGATLAAGNDWAPGTTPANGDLLFNFGLRGGLRPDVLTMEIFFSPIYPY